VNTVDLAVEVDRLARSLQVEAVELLAVAPRGALDLRDTMASKGAYAISHIISRSPSLLEGLRAAVGNP